MSVNSLKHRLLDFSSSYFSKTRKIAYKFSLKYFSSCGRYISNKILFTEFRVNCL